MPAKRRLSRQQRQRIEAAQQTRARGRRQLQGRVIAHHGRELRVELADGTRFECRIRTNLGVIVCGDRVGIEDAGRGEKRVVAVLGRDNLLQRLDGFGQPRAVAANLSQLVVCLAVNPPPNLLLLDQYLASAEQLDIDALILLNKIDLLEDGADDPFGLAGTYAPLGYRVIATSVTTGAGMADFRAALRDRVSVLAGVSGVGKSSLTAWLMPDEPIKIAPISSANDEGRHTTRVSRLYHLDDGGDLVDTPGVRGFTPYLDDGQPPARGFREIAAAAAACRFNDCSHREEPRCAVVDALARGEIASSRYENYLRLLEARA